MKQRAFALAVAALAYLAAPLASAEPILKPHKYYGPIPQSSISLRIGMLGGASNEKMIDYLDGRVQPPFEPVHKDFGNGLTAEVSYEHKPHPHFGVRVNASASFLSSTGDGVIVPQIATGDSLLPALRYHREFKVDLFVVELSGIYHFTDAAVKEFQPYVGGGFSIGFPHEKITESRIDTDTGLPFTREIRGVPRSADEWDVSAGVHMVGGAIYYLSNRFGICGEGRVQFMEGRFDQIEAVNEIGEFEGVGFVIDYSGFFLTIGAVYAF